MAVPPALEESRLYAVRTVPALRPLFWLRLGARDLMRCPRPGLMHGAALAAFGALLLLVAGRQFWWLAGAFSGFLLVSPILATGLYVLSRELEAGRPATWRAALRAWWPDKPRLMTFGLLLALAGTGWVMTSASLITGFAAEPVRNPADFLRVVVLAPESVLFEAWLVLGGVLAAPVFASSVVAIPLLLDREISVFGAVLTSWRVVMENPLTMAVWAALIMGLTVLGMLSLLLGLIVVVPWLGHSSWHAYRDLITAPR